MDPETSSVRGKRSTVSGAEESAWTVGSSAISRSLSEEGALLRTLVDAVPDLVFFKDREGRHLAMNVAAERFFGVESIGRTVFERGLSREIAEGYAADDLRVLETGEPLLNREEPFVAADGRRGVLLTCKYPLRDGGGRVNGLLGIARDISEIKRAMAELDRTQRQLIGHVENSPLAVIEWSADFRVELWTGQARVFFGWAAEEVMGRHFGEWPLVHGEDAEAFAGYLAKLGAAGEQGHVFETRNLTKGGAVLHCVWQNSVLRDGEGRAVSILSLVKDVTGEVLAQQKVREHEQLYYTLVEATNTGYVRLDEAGRVVECNEEFLRLTGRSASGELEGASLQSLLAPQDRERVMQEYSEGLASGFIRNLELELLAPSGRITPVELNARVRSEVGGRRVLAFCMDISSRREREVERQAFDRQLQETQKLESLGILAGSIAHDFNNLLTGIIGNANLARTEGGDNVELQVFLDQIEIAATRAADLCRQMLAFSGKGKFVLEMLNINGAVEETARLVQVSISKKVELEYSLFPELPNILADATQIRQVLMNLLINAAEAIGDGRGTIRVSTRMVSIDEHSPVSNNLVGALAPGRYVCLRVRDSGAGMPAEVRQRIFEPFFTTKVTGRGLGLAAVLGIIRSHKGALSVESEEGKGTTFELHFPCAIEVEGGPDRGVALNKGWTGCGTVLVVDDEETVRITVSLMLQALGFLVRHVADGEEAVAAVADRDEDFSMVLLDLTMPQLHGDEALAEMRRYQPNLKAIVMSGYDEDEVMVRFGKEPVNAFLQKPFRLPQLRSKIQQLLAP